MYKVTAATAWAVQVWYGSTNFPQEGFSEHYWLSSPSGTGMTDRESDVAGLLMDRMALSPSALYVKAYRIFDSSMPYRKAGDLVKVTPGTLIGTYSTGSPTLLPLEVAMVVREQNATVGKGVQFFLRGLPSTIIGTTGAFSEPSQWTTNFADFAGTLAGGSWSFVIKNPAVSLSANPNGLAYEITSLQKLALIRKRNQGRNFRPLVGSSVAR